MTAELPVPASPGGLDRLLGLTLTRADEDLVEGRIPVTEDLLQGHGIVHGGVYCAIIETTCSVGASIRAGREHRVVGLSNKTNFWRSARPGTTLTVVAEFAEADDPRQLWSATIRDSEGRLVADGQVQLLRLDLG